MNCIRLRQQVMRYTIDDEDSPTNRRKQFLERESSSKMVHRILKIFDLMKGINLMRDTESSKCDNKKRT